MKQAVILLAYGGPESLDDIPAYLLDIRGGRPTSQELIDDISDRYRQIGGRSPLLDITNDVANKVAAEIELPVYVGMRHWPPYIADVVKRMAADGIELGCLFREISAHHGLPRVTVAVREETLLGRAWA